MNPQNQEAGADANNGAGEDKAEMMSITREEWENTQRTLGSLKREVKDSRKSQETPSTKQPDDSRSDERYERLALKAKGITHPDDQDAARKWANKMGLDIDVALDDEDFQMKLGRMQRERSNIEATSGIKGSGGDFKSRNTPEHWIAKGVPPTRDDVPNRAQRVAIQRAMMDQQKKGKTFYNDYVKTSGNLLELTY